MAKTVSLSANRFKEISIKADLLHDLYRSVEDRRQCYSHTYEKDEETGEWKYLPKEVLTEYDEICIKVCDDIMGELVSLID